MAKGFTPIIGLAVVVALAMVAVFGALSLTSPTSVLAQQIDDPIAKASVSVDASSEDPGDNARYTLKFTAEGNTGDATFAAGADEITIKMEDFGLPSSIARTDVSMRIPGGGTGTGTVNPDAVTVSGSEVILLVPDFNLTDDVQRGIQGEDEVTIFFQQSADITNPTEGGETFPGKVYPWEVEGVSSTDPEGNYDFSDYSTQFGSITLVEDNPQAGEAIGTPVPPATTCVVSPIQATPYADLCEQHQAVVEEAEEKSSVRVPIIIDIDASDNEASRGDTITLTGKGYKNGTTLTFWLDYNADGTINDGGTTLCTTDVGSTDTGSCDFQVANPPFAPDDARTGGTCEVVAGVEDDADTANVDETVTAVSIMYCNFINAVDGREQTATLRPVPTATEMEGDYNDQIADYTLLLQPSLSATPIEANPGQRVLLQLEDYKPGADVTGVKVAGRDVPNFTNRTIDTGGSQSFSISVPNGVPEGKQSLQIFIGGKGKDRVTLDIGGPEIKVSPDSAVANQRVSLVGSGFTPNSKVIKIAVGNVPVYEKTSAQSDIDVSNGGSWTHSIIMPISAGTTVEGTQTILVTDDAADEDNDSTRTGSAQVAIPAREVTIDPDTSRVNTLATVTGKNFPSRNDDSPVSVIVDIRYEPSEGSGAGTRTSVNPDAGGNFTTSLRIPTTATPGSTNSIVVQFNYGDDNVPVITTVTHDVPAGEISLSKESGPPGTPLTVTGVGFRTFIPVNEVLVGGIDVTPSPKPQTDAQGNLSFDLVIPGVGSGIQNVEVKVGGGNAGTTASTGFDVTTSGVAAGDSVLVADGVTPLGENFVRSFHFNNDTKMWTFYDPEAGDASTQEHFIAGETYWILVEMTVTDAILNGKTRNLTCVDGNCWNQIVW